MSLKNGYKGYALTTDNLEAVEKLPEFLSEKGVNLVGPHAGSYA